LKKQAGQIDYAIQYQPKDQIYFAK